MTIGIDGNFPPMGFMDENGQYTGFDVELAQESAKRLGIGLKIKTINWDDKLEELNNKNIDMIWSGMTVTEERWRQVLFSDPYIDEGYVLVAKKDSQIVTNDQLEKAKIGFLSSLNDYGFLDDDNVINNNMRDNLKEFRDEKVLLQALDAGEIDAFFARKIDTQYNLIKDSDKYKLLRFLFDKEDWAVAFRINDIYLRDAIQKTIDEMKKDGTYGEILSKWFGKDRVNHISYDENRNIIYNGNSYSQCEDINWRAGEISKRLGAVSQWGDYLKFYHFDMELEAGVSEVKGSKGIALHINPPNSEFDALYLRSDIKAPELTADNIDRIELTKGYMGYDHVTCNNGTTDKDTIKEFMNLILNAEAAKIDAPYSSRETVLLYSNALPGCFYPILLYEKDDLRFLEFDHKLVIISDELLNKLGNIHYE